MRSMTMAYREREREKRNCLCVHGVSEQICINYIQDLQNWQETLLLYKFNCDSASIIIIL